MFQNDNGFVYYIDIHYFYIHKVKINFNTVMFIKIKFLLPNKFIYKYQIFEKETYSCDDVSYLRMDEKRVNGVLLLFKHQISRINNNCNQYYVGTRLHAYNVTCKYTVTRSIHQRR